MMNCSFVAEGLWMRKTPRGSGVSGLWGGRLQWGARLDLFKLVKCSVEASKQQVIVQTTLVQ